MSETRNIPDSNTLMIPDAKMQITEFEASQLYGLSVHWFRRKRWEGGGPAFRKVGNRCYYTRTVLAEYFNACSCNNTSEYHTRKPVEAIAKRRAV